MLIENPGRLAGVFVYQSLIDNRFAESINCIQTLQIQILRSLLFYLKPQRNQ